MESSFPYANASSGEAARGEITRLLRRFGCESIGFLDDYANHSVVLQFVHRGRTTLLNASAKGWANGYLRENPWSARRRVNQAAWSKRALDQGMIAINSILRDWVKGQVTAIECGIMEFDAAFMPHMLMRDGRRVIDVMRDQKLLPAPDPGPEEGGK